MNDWRQGVFKNNGKEGSNSFPSVFAGRGESANAVYLD